MKPPAKKKAGRLPGRRVARRPATAGKPVTLPARYRSLLAQARTIIGHADECLDEITNNLQRGETWEYSANVASLRRVFGSARRLHPFLKNLERHARKEVAL